jgi:hypothetical protein
MLVDQKSESVVVPLNTELGSPGKLELANSMSFHSIRGVITTQKIDSVLSRFSERVGGSRRKSRCF